jgi:hypothetical protein
LENAKRKILIATPAYDGQISTLTVLSVIGSIKEAQDRGWEARFLPIVGAADIADVRNQILGTFLNSICDDLLFVDADIGWCEGTFSHIMQHNVDCVAGLYRQRTDQKIHYPVRWPDERNLWIDPETNVPLLEANGVPAGFLRLSKKCVRAVADHVNIWVQDPVKAEGRPYPFVFDWKWFEINGERHRLSEDFTFCQYWRETGGQVWVDPALKLNHVGPACFKGDLMKHLETETMLEGKGLFQPIKRYG